MITLEQARRTAQIYLARLEKELGCELELIDTETRRVANAWLFLYNSSDFLKSRRYQDALAGNAPFLVEKEGEVVLTGTALPLDEYLGDFENLTRLKTD